MKINRMVESDGFRAEIGPFGVITFFGWPQSCSPEQLFGGMAAVGWRASFIKLADTVRFWFGVKRVR